jgi:hypothetical protein
MLMVAVFCAVPALATEPPPAAMGPALLVIDVRNAFMSYMAEQDTRIAPLTRARYLSSASFHCPAACPSATSAAR